MHFAAFDVTTTSRADLVALLARLDRGGGADDRRAPGRRRNDEPLLPPDDTGEAFGHLPSRLTITFGFGPGLFEREGVDRFGLAALRPAELRQFGAAAGGGDRPGDLRRRPLRPGVLGRSSGRLPRGPQPGPDRARHGRRPLVAARLRPNLDDDPGAGHAAQPDGPQGRHEQHPRRGHARRSTSSSGPARRRRSWLRGGTYLVSRRIRMLIESWDRTALAEQERTIGRAKYSGAPLTGIGGARHPRLRGPRARRPGDRPRRAHPAELGRCARGSGYSAAATRSPTASRRSPAQLDAGLFFICFQRDPKQFETIQRRLSSDILNEYIVHTSSAVFAVPPGVAEGGVRRRRRLIA